MSGRIKDEVVKLFNLMSGGDALFTESRPKLGAATVENYLYLTLPLSINFHRSRHFLWQSATRTYDDEDTKYLFSPPDVLTRSVERVKHDMLKHKLALRDNKQFLLWIKLCSILLRYYNSDPREILKEAGYDAVQILKNTRVLMRVRFNNLGTEENSLYWLQLLDRYTDARLINLHRVPIMADEIVATATMKLGISKHPMAPDELDELWSELLVNTGITPFKMRQALHAWAANGYRREP